MNILQEGEFAESCCGADLRHGVFRGDGNSSRMRLLLSWLNACTCCPSLTNKIIQRDAAVSNSVAVGCAIIENRAEHLVTQSKIKAKNKKKSISYVIGKIKIIPSTDRCCSVVFPVYRYRNIVPARKKLPQEAGFIWWFRFNYSLSSTI